MFRNVAYWPPILHYDGIFLKLCIAKPQLHAHPLYQLLHHRMPGKCYSGLWSNNTIYRFSILNVYVPPLLNFLPTNPSAPLKCQGPQKMREFHKPKECAKHQRTDLWADSEQRRLLRIKTGEDWAWPVKLSSKEGHQNLYIWSPISLIIYKDDGSNEAHKILMLMLNFKL